MSSTSDAMRIVVELIEETIGRIVLRDVMKSKENVKEQEDTKQDDMMNFNWVEV